MLIYECQQSTLWNYKLYRNLNISRMAQRTRCSVSKVNYTVLVHVKLPRSRKNSSHDTRTAEEENNELHRLKITTSYLIHPQQYISLGGWNMLPRNLIKVRDTDIFYVDCNYCNFCICDCITQTHRQDCLLSK